MYRVLSVLVLTLLFPSWGYAQTNSLSQAERINDLRQYVDPVRTVDPADEDFSDLEPLKSAIGDRRIVILGEPTHGDGTAFRAKSRLVKFLHQELNFDVLAFETGLYDLRLATRQATSPEEYLRAAINNLSRPWAESQQARPVLRYYAKTKQTDDPLHLAGIDGALRSPNDSIFVARLKRHLKGRDLWNEITAGTEFETTLRKQLTNPLFLARDTTAYRQFIDRLNNLQGRLNGGSSEDEFWSLMLENVKAMAQTGYQRSYEPRNRQMANNLVWLAEQEYPKEKIIVWIASSHGIRNLSSIDTMDPELSYEGQQSMGDFLDEQLGKKVYTLGFTAEGGRYGAFYWRDSEPSLIEAPSKRSLEALLGAMPHDYAILDFTGVPDDHWLSSPQVARPLGYDEMRADWTKVMDGLMFIRTMEPNTKIQE